ncbi:hypothetical protein [Chryseobacterium oranimense]|uniref:hypothetical protein n=1 Tax=Chryseobacterium oranimense TaxID=421058 RepID=UPI0005339EE0|nr:hypothetical protein [Chryseobacterium oranimense]CEJ68523.1 hypothetical protein BN1195_00811 [Chryseobacterium oranimense G311]
MKKKLENLNAKKLKFGNLKDILGGRVNPDQGFCGGTGTADDPYQIETVTIIRGGGAQFDSCD